MRKQHQTSQSVIATMYLTQIARKEKRIHSKIPEHVLLGHARDCPFVGRTRDELVEKQPAADSNPNQQLVDAGRIDIAAIAVKLLVRNLRGSVVNVVARVIVDIDWMRHTVDLAWLPFVPSL